jgi:hypothetical protein
MVSSVTFPNIVSDKGGRSSSILLKRPASVRLVINDLIEKISLENCIISLKVLFLYCVLYISEMRIVFKLEAFGLSESSEGFVSLNFMLWGQFNRSLRNYVAIIFNSSHVIMKSIDFFQINSNN